MEKRLKSRYEQLVRSHMVSGNELAAGIKSQLKDDIAFSQTQAAWRFLNNDSCTLAELSKPLLKVAHELSETECDTYALVVHDWSHLSYGKHTSKQDTYNTIKRNIGYLLQTSLMLSDKHGGPLSPLAMNLKDNKQIHSTYSQESNRNITNLEKLSLQIEWLGEQTFRKKLVHIIDREADSIGFIRSLGTHCWLIRGKGGNKVLHGENSKKIQDIAKDLSYNEMRTIHYKNRKANQYIAETEITIIRPAKPEKKGVNGKRVNPIKGDPVKCRLIVSKIIDACNKEVAVWYLLSNLIEVDKATIALWYYWRWSIENYFKLMKSAGMQLESWQQTTSLAIARRILIASMACVWIWRIAHATGPEASKIRKILVRLSGRQMKWGKEFSYPALFAGLWSLLAIDDMITHHGLEEIKSLISGIFGDKRLM
jgi:hypothetical protein